MNDKKIFHFQQWVCCITVVLVNLLQLSVSLSQVLKVDKGLNKRDKI